MEEMSELPFVSVVVPAYNAEITLEKTIKDILAQTFKDFELILVNDGSTDNTEDICRSFAETDERVRVITQKNGGLSCARNAGTRSALGTYISFVDSDDRIEQDCIECLVDAVRSHPSSIACGGIDRVREDFDFSQANKSPRSTPVHYETFAVKDAMRVLFTKRNSNISACCRLVPTEWQLKHPFLEGKYYEDLSNTYKVNFEAQSVVFIDKVLYHYVMRGGSITGRINTSKGQCFDYYEAINLCTNKVIEKFPDIQADAAVLKARDYMSLFLTIHRCTEKQNEQLIEIEKSLLTWFKANWKTVVFNTLAPLGLRMRVLLFAVNPALYELVYYKGIKIKGKAIG